jgi:cytochrome c oxidase cbb3-type subunit 1
MHPYYAMRFVGGAIYNLGAWIMLFNVVMTVRQASTAHGTNAVPAKA